MSGRGDRGQSIVELVLIVPVLLIVALGIVDTGRALYYDNVVGRAAQQGAAAAATGATVEDIRATVRKAADPVVIGNEGITVVPQDPQGRPRGTTVTVGVSYIFTPLTPLVGNLFPDGHVKVARDSSLLSR